MSECKSDCELRPLLVAVANAATERLDLVRNHKPCTRRLWGDPVGLLCSRPDPHVPGPATCRYVGNDYPE